MPLPRRAQGRADGARSQERRGRSGSSPAALSAAASQISGRPISAVGSCDAMLLEQHDAEPLGLEAARAVERLLEPQVAFERGDVETRETGPPCGRRATSVVAECRVDHGDGRVEQRRSCPGRRGAARRRPRGARLAQQPAVERGDLIGADHDRAARRDARAPSRGRGARPSLRALSPSMRVLVGVGRPRRRTAARAAPAARGDSGRSRPG